MSERRMPLGHALQILCDNHTRADDRAGYVVEGSRPIDFGRWSESDYLEAWRIVRLAAGLSVDPVMKLNDYGFWEKKHDH